MAKQVIVFRKDLKVRKGKYGAQVAHASLKVILNMMTLEIDIYERSQYKKRTLTYAKDSPIDQWINGTFTKIMVSCKNEEELLSLYAQAQEANIPCALIRDAGKTEFKKPTNTCLAIGPGNDDEINKITDNLPLL